MYTILSSKADRSEETINTFIHNSFPIRETQFEIKLVNHFLAQKRRKCQGKKKATDANFIWKNGNATRQYIHIIRSILFTG